MKQIKDIGWYLLELLAVFALLYGLFRGYVAIRNSSYSSEGGVNAYLVYTTAYPLVFGVLIRIPGLIRRWSSQRQFHWLRFWVLVAPVLLLFAQLFIAVILKNRVWLPTFSLSNVVFPLLGVWVGVNLTDCIKEKERRSES